jgi:hypothetical protein
LNATRFLESRLPAIVVLLQRVAGGAPLLRKPRNLRSNRVRVFKSLRVRKQAEKKFLTIEHPTQFGSRLFAARLNEERDIP